MSIIEGQIEYEERCKRRSKPNRTNATAANTNNNNSNNKTSTTIVVTNSSPIQQDVISSGPNNWLKVQSKKTRHAQYIGH